AGELGGEPAQQLVAAFQARTKRTPTTAAAQAFDAAALVAAARAEAVRGSPAKLRPAMRAALAHARLADGACGDASIGPDGELVRVPSVLEVQGDDLVIVP